MAFLVVNGVTVPVAAGSVNKSFAEIGDKARTFDGTMRQTIRSRVASYSGKTIPLTWADASSVEDALNAASQPHNCSGTMLSSGGATNVSMFTGVTGANAIQSANEERWVISFNAEESS